VLLMPKTLATHYRFCFRFDFVSTAERSLTFWLAIRALQVMTRPSWGIGLAQRMNQLTGPVKTFVTELSRALDLMQSRNVDLAL